MSSGTSWARSARAWSQALMASGVRMEDPEDVMEMYGFVKTIRHRNEQVDEAVDKLTKIFKQLEII